MTTGSAATAPLDGDGGVDHVAETPAYTDMPTATWVKASATGNRLASEASNHLATLTAAGTAEGTATSSQPHPTSPLARPPLCPCSCPCLSLSLFKCLSFCPRLCWTSFRLSRTSSCAVLRFLRSHSSKVASSSAVGSGTELGRSSPHLWQTAQPTVFSAWHSAIWHDQLRACATRSFGAVRTLL